MSATLKASSKLLLPRGYLSWTQLDLIEKNEREYIRKYIDGLERPENEYQAFGKIIAEVLEGKQDGDPIAELLKATIRKYKTPEYDMRATLKTAGVEVELYGKPDSYDEAPTHSIEEYKTGKVKWTQAKADKHGQMLLYATMVYINHGVLPEEVGLTWAQTEDTMDGVFLTGHVERYPVKYTQEDVMKMMVRIVKAARRIDTLYRAAIAQTFS